VKNKKILMVGGAGYIGSHCVKYMRRNGYDATVMDNFSTGHAESIKGVSLVQADLRIREDCRRALATGPYDAVFHFAAFCAIGESVKEPAKYYENNVVGTFYLLDEMRKAGVSRFIFSSTCATFGVPERIPIDEGQRQWPVNPYGWTKLDVEIMLEHFRQAYGLSYSILRYFNAAGADPEGELGEEHPQEGHLIPCVIFKALGRRKSLTIFGNDYPTPDGTCVRDYIHVMDLAEAHRLAMERMSPGSGDAFHLGNGNGYSNLEVIRCVESISGAKVDFEYGPRREGDPPLLIGDSSRANEILGWKPKYPELETIVKTAYDWHSKHPKGYKS